MIIKQNYSKHKLCKSAALPVHSVSESALSFSFTPSSGLINRVMKY